MCERTRVESVRGIPTLEKVKNSSKNDCFQGCFGAFRGINACKAVALLRVLFAGWSRGASAKVFIYMPLADYVRCEKHVFLLGEGVGYLFFRMYSGHIPHQFCLGI